MVDFVASAYLTKLRDNHPHAVMHYMSVYEPVLVYVGTVSGAYARGSYQITVVNVSGNIANVRDGDSVYVGTASGSKSISVRRLRSRSGQILTLDENSVVWTAGDYISVYHDSRLWGVWPREIKVGGTYTWYKDYDVAYAGENRYPPPVARMGWHRAKIMYGSSVTFVLNSADSHAVAFGATVISRIWSCSTGTIANNTAIATTITFMTLGQHEVWLSVTDSNGKSQSTYRIYFVHDVPGPNATYPPFLDFSMESGITLDWTNGGASAQLSMQGDELKDFPDNALAVIWSENYFTGILDTISMFGGSTGFAAIANDGNVRTKFVGYIMNQGVPVSDVKGRVTVSLATIDAMMKKISMSSIALNNKASPTKWYEMYKLTVTRAIHHYWRYHSNLFSITDVVLPTDDTLEMFASDDLVEGTLYGSADTFSYQYGTFAHVCCDKYGRVHLAKDVCMLSVGNRVAVQDYFTIRKDDLKMENPESGSYGDYVQDTLNRVLLAIIRGYSYVGSVNTPLISQSPGEISDPGDSVAAFERIVLENQAHANMLSGRVFYIGNRRLVELRFTFAGNYYDILDVVPQLWLPIDITSLGDYNLQNILDENLSGDYIIKSLSYSVDASGTPIVKIVLEPDVISVDGVTITWPVTPADENPSPEPPVPPEPPAPPPIPPTPPPLGTGDAVVTTTSDDRTSDNLTDANPDWDSEL